MATIETNSNGNSVHIPAPVFGLLVFLFVQAGGAIWWAATQNAKLDMVLMNQTESVKVNRELEDEIKAQKIYFQTEIDTLKTYNQDLRERLAAHGLLGEK